MCGIGGWIAFGDSRPPRGVADTLLEKLEFRGEIASGLAWYSDWGKQAKVAKNSVRGSRLLKHPKLSQLVEEIDQSRVCFVHTRFPTVGDAKNPKNNHPVFREDGRYLLVHNGSISNHNGMFTGLGLTREAEVDTEALVAALDSGDTIEESLKLISHATGSFAIIAASRHELKDIILIRRTSPIIYTYDDTKDIFYFASTTEALSPLVEPRGLLRNIPGLSNGWFREVADNSFWHIGREGLVKKGKHTYEYDAKFWSCVNPLALTSGMDGSSTRKADTSKYDIWKPECAWAKGEDDYYFVWEDNTVELFGIEGMFAEMETAESLDMLKIHNTSNQQFIRCGACWCTSARKEIHEKGGKCPHCLSKLTLVK